MTSQEEITFERREKSPIIKERIIPQRTVEVQQVIHREIEQREIHHIIQPIKKTEILPTIYERVDQPIEYRSEAKESSERIEGSESSASPSSVIREPAKIERITKEPIIHETYKKTIVEEIQPIIYKEVIQPTIPQNISSQGKYQPSVGIIYVYI